MKNRLRLQWAAFLCLIIVLPVSCALYLRTLALSPEHPVLIGEEDAIWLKPDANMELMAHFFEGEAAVYRVHFRVDRDVSEAILFLRTMQRGDVYLNGRWVYGTGPSTDLWKRQREIDLARMLRVGENELRIVVMNSDGPPCVLAYCNVLNLATGPGWQVSRDAISWKPAVSVNVSRPSELSRHFTRADKALLKSLPLLVSVFAFVFMWSLGGTREGSMSAWTRRLTPSPRWFRWMLMAAVAVLGANNMFKLAYFYGFDFRGHIDYIRYVADEHRIPLPTDGWAMFQAPLYYLLSAPLLVIFERIFEPERAMQALRVLPLACGVAQIEVSFRAGRYLFPAREDLQRVATAVGGLLPAGLYMAQYVSNETLAGLLAGMVVVLALRFHCDPVHGRTWPALALLGLVLGLAWLSKLTAMFLMPPLVALMAYDYVARDEADGVKRRVFRMVGAGALVFGLATVVAGWYYARNYIELGRAFWGGWEPERGIDWWQDPGYRTFQQLIPTREAFYYPIYASVTGFWDGVYASLWSDSYIGAMTEAADAPPWNYNLMLGGVWLALIPATLMVLGAARALSHGRQNVGLVYMVATLATFWAMLLYGFFSVPYYCVVKGQYTIGLACCYGALAAAGFALVSKNRWLRATMTGALAAWAVAAYAAYFVVE